MYLGKSKIGDPVMMIHNGKAVCLKLCNIPLSVLTVNGDQQTIYLS